MTSPTPRFANVLTLACLFVSALLSASCIGNAEDERASGASTTAEVAAARTEAVVWERLGLEVYCTTNADCLSAAPACGASRCNTAANLCEFSLRPANFICRAPSSDPTRLCDAPELCTGTSYDCPADSTGTSVGEVQPAGTICRPSAGGCDQAEVCNGASQGCPSDNLRPAGFICRSAASECDAAESCDGLTSACPADAFAPATVSCRPAAGECDKPEMCTGSSGLCPLDEKLTSVCRPAVGACDVPESCGGSNECPPDQLSPANTTCRAAEGACDVAEVCTGNSAVCPSDAVADATSVCRASAGPCDAPELCNGTAKTCGENRPQPAGYVCREAVEGTCDAPEVCSGRTGENSCPADVARPNGFVCRPSMGACDAPETCNGTMECPPDGFSAAGTVCRPAIAGVGGRQSCDVPEMCTGTARECPADGFKGNDVVCANTANTDGMCTGDTYCSGNSGVCPATPPPALALTGCTPTNATEVNGMYPTRTGGCTGGGVCNGTSTMCPLLAVRTSGACTESCGSGTCNASGACAGQTPRPAGTVCRNKRDVCDVQEVCSGSSLSCPGDGFEPSTTVCRESLHPVCDPAETCTGAGIRCPRDARAPNTTVCRASGGLCDVEEYCQGFTPTPLSIPGDSASAQCPGDAVLPSGTMCESSRNNGCDLPDFCDGTTKACANQAQPSGFVCRAQSELACDAAETCNGTENACPNDAPAASGVVCRAAAGVCDVAETCNGSSFDCPAIDVRAASGTVCRPSSGALCDVAETCDGRASECPSNRVAIAGTICRPAAGGGCDVAELCNGMTEECPAQRYKPAGTLCSSPTQACERAGVCTGTGAVCPVAYAPNTTVCRPSAGDCDLAERCTGSSLSCPPNSRVSAGTICRASTDPFCDPAESCNGTSDVCPSNVVRPNGDRYDQNGNLCDGIDTCVGGMLTPPSVSVTDCDDGNPCTADSCHPTLGCQNTQVANGTSCTTDAFCTLRGTETCQMGQCVGTPRDCGIALDPACFETSCDEERNQCVNVPSPTRPATCADDNIKPYVLLVLDNSGSMNTAIPSSPAMPIAPENSCGEERTRMSDAKCAVTNVVSSYGEAVFGLASYTTTGSGSTNINPPAECATLCDRGSCSYTSLNCSTCDVETGAGCPPNGADASQGTIVSPILDDNQSSLLRWTDFQATTCATNPNTSANPELVADAQTFTPLAGVLNSARAYFENGVPARGWPSPVDLDNPCRPYYVVLLTDGQESCAQLEETRAAAIALRTTMVPGAMAPIDIRTYVIALGVRDPLELGRLDDLVIAGGTNLGEDFNGDGRPDGTGVIVAENEADIALAFAQILERTVLVEVCNGRDDNCNGRVDEGFTKYCANAGGLCPEDMSIRPLCEDPGDPCNNVDDNGVNGTSDEVRNRCGSCGDDREVCDGLDNNCDGRVDEHDESQPAVGGVYPPCACTPSPEICDGLDNDCDTGMPGGGVDEGLVRDCGSDVGECSRGTQVCNLGTWGPCGDRKPSVEVCDNKDNDCDGVVDGIGERCGEHGIQIDGSLAFFGQCVAGERLCVGGAWTECSGDTGPSDEICDGVDNDCDMVIDEGNPGSGAGCSLGCGPGTINCVAGRLVCVGASTGDTETCDGMDNDCDGEIDEDIPDGAACNFVDLRCELPPSHPNALPASAPECAQMLCIAGVRSCVGGEIRCVGGGFEEPERCDCLDNDCDGQADENNADGSSLCGEGGATCLGAGYCQCARPCTVGTEFPCPSGQICTDLRNPAAGFCVRDPCFGVSCTEGRSPEVNGNTCECVSECEVRNCPEGYICRDGEGCIADRCEADPGRCGVNQFCVNGECENNLCDGVECPEGDFCRAGVCRSSCAGVVCRGGSRCEDGVCTTDRCASVTCDAGTACDPNDGTCKPNRCGGIRCGDNSTCNPITGACETNLCLGVVCPSPTEICVEGECVTASDAIDGGTNDREDRVLATGGGGFACSTTGGSSNDSALGWLLTMGTIAAFVSRRGRGGVR